MTASAAPTTADLEEQIARIRRMSVETEKFVAEARKLNTDAAIAPFSLVITGFAAGAAMVGAVAAILKLLGP